MTEIISLALERAKHPPPVYAGPWLCLWVNIGSGYAVPGRRWVSDTH